MKFIRTAILLLFVCSNVAMAKDPVPNDFAYGIRLEVTGNDALYESRLPLEVYRGVTRDNLQDICVFNGQKERVPFMVRRPTGEVAAANETITLPIFSVPGNPYRKPAGMSLQVRKDRTGSIIDVATDGTAPARKVIAYLVDAGKLGRPVSALEAELQPLAEGSVVKVTVESSNDLEHWTTLVSGATIVRLSYGNQSLERRSIEFEAVRAKYFRLSSPESGEMPQLKGVNARLAASTIEAPRQWVTITAAVKNGKPDEYRFDTAGHMPVDRIRINLPQDNSLVKATFYSRADTGRPWIPRQSSLLYRLRIKGMDVTGPEIALYPTTDRHWLMRVEQGGGGLGKGMPQLQYGWVPEKLEFIARGYPPFTLAYGSSRTRPYIQRGEDVLKKFRELQQENAVAKTVTTGPQITLGGPAMLRRGITPQDWKTAILWTALGLGVALLTWMAIRLYKQMDQAP